MTFEILETGKDSKRSRTYVLDATETGELLPLAKAEYVIGANRKRHERTARH